MFRITHSSNFNTSIQALVLIQQISSTHHISADRYMRTLYESLLDPRLLKSSKQTMYLNLLYKSLKDDISVRRVKAFVKRLLQIISLHEPSFACAILYLVGALQTSVPSLKAMLSTPEALDEDEEEAFADVLDAADAPAVLPPPSKVNPSHHSSRYDGRKRDPEHSNADRTCLWELAPWRAHYHPSASLFAQRLLENGPQPPKPDPVSHTLMHFLDRFAYRNVKPKSVDATTRGTSLMQPALGNAGAADRLIGAGTGATGAVGAEINTEAFWSKQVADVAADEVFFHRYFSDLAPHKKAKKAAAKKKGVADDDSDVDVDPELDADEDEIWKALVGSKPDIDAGSDVDVDDDDDEDEDMDMDGFEQAMEYGDSDGEGSEGEGERDLEDVLGSDFDDDGEEDADESGLALDDANVATDVEAADAEDDDDDDDDDDDNSPFGLEEESDAIFDSDEDAPVALPTADELLALTEVKKGSKGRESRQDRNAKRRKLSTLPIFASADDYAKLLENDDEDM